jgi:DNA invertase Pin-like site-specific DNA recombinase
MFWKPVYYDYFWVNNYPMKKVVHFIRKSTVAQELDHQENLLNETSKQNGWEVVEVIRETISGTKKNEDRKGIIHLQDLISRGGIDLVVVWEISRISRSPREFHNLLSFLHDRGVGLYIKNLNLFTLTDDGKENHITSFLLALFAEVAKMETSTLSERVRVSLNNLRRNGIILGRPVGTKEDEAKLLKKYPDAVKYIKMGLSIREVSKLTKLAINTTNKISKIVRGKSEVSTLAGVLEN